MGRAVSPSNRATGVKQGIAILVRILHRQQGVFALLPPGLPPGVFMYWPLF